MDWSDLDLRFCSSVPATLDEIHEYLNEEDVQKRIELAYKYQISKDHLYLEDYNLILQEIDDALHDFTD